jgi:hypothetical protein
MIQFSLLCGVLFLTANLGHLEIKLLTKCLPAVETSVDRCTACNRSRNGKKIFNRFKLGQVSIFNLFLKDDVSCRLAV